MTRVLALARFMPPPPDLDPLEVLGWVLFVLGPVIALFGAFS